MPADLGVSTLAPMYTYAVRLGCEPKQQHANLTHKCVPGPLCLWRLCTLMELSLPARGSSFPCLDLL